MKFGLFYGSTTCYTEMAAEKIRDAIGAELVELHNVKETPLTQMHDYDVLILGISTWDFGELQEDWDAIWHSLDDLDLSGKIIALYGLGDQIGYGEWFLDAMGLLHDKLLACGAQLIGYWPVDGYTFTASKALTADNSAFVGLALDEENQYELSDERIADWSGLILLEIEALL
ncbi:MAG: flavodoxin FldB [Plesiomonas sp.]